MDESSPPQPRRFSLLRAVLLVVAVVVVLGGLGVGAVYLYRAAPPLTLAGRGGTILVYEADAENVPPEKFAELPAALLRRIDPTGRWGVTVELVGTNRVKIGLPRTPHYQEDLAELKELLASSGALEFRIEANEQDDKPAIEAARAALDRDAGPPELREVRSKELQTLAEMGQPPPPPGGGRTFEWHNGVTGPEARWGEATYVWVELGREMRAALQLREIDGGMSENAKRAAAAREAGKTFVADYGSEVLLYSRNCVNQRLSPAEREDKRFDAFVLTRVPEPEQRVGGADLVSSDVGQDSRGNPTILFEFNTHGGNLFYQLTEKNQPTGAPAFHRHLAILLDDHVISAPSLNEPIRNRGQITGNFTLQQTNLYVRLLRAGTLPVRLKPLPVSEVVVEPSR